MTAHRRLPAPPVIHARSAHRQRGRASNSWLGHAPAQFSWSNDGKTFQPIGKPFVMGTDWPFFIGYRYPIFNYATKSLGGKVRIAAFTMEQSPR